MESRQLFNCLWFSCNNMPTIRAKLLDYSEDIGGYIVYVFIDLDYIGATPSPYVMVTRFPNWNAPMYKIGDSGFLSYKDVVAGQTDWWDGHQYHKYKYTDSVFEKFILDRPKEGDVIL